MQNVASGDVRCLISICRTGQFLLHVLSKLRDMARKKKFTKQPTSNWNYMFIPTIVLKKNIYRVISVILLLVNDKDPLPPFNIHIFSPKTIVWSKFRTLYALADEYTKNLHQFWIKRINLKNLINWPLNRPFSHLIFVTFSLNGTLSHVAVMAVT